MSCPVLNLDSSAQPGRNRRFIQVLTIALACWLTPGTLPAAEDAILPDSASFANGLPSRRVYNTTRLVDAAPRIDGQLDDACWQRGKWAGGYTQREPFEGEPGSEPTFLKILYDDENLYVAIRAVDSAIDSVQFERGNRDQFTGEMVGVSFDSYFDRRTAFEFNVTSGGSKVDLVTDGNRFDTSWDAVWDVKVGHEPDAWTAEYRIPLSQLRYASRPGEQVWGLHSWRTIKRLQEESSWQLIPMDNPGFVYSFGELHGISDLKPSRQIEIVPYVVARRSTHQREANHPYRTGSVEAFDAGLDAKIGLASNFTADFTFNPDFGQVEADPSEINLSTFETFRRERRPFFLEGKNIFDFEVGGSPLFYSRRIGKAPSLRPATDGYRDVPTATRILAAAKFSGKTPGGLAAGVVYGLTAEETARITEDGTQHRQIVEPSTHYVVARAQQDFNDGETTLGGIVTSTTRDITDDALAFLPQKAVTGGIDLHHLWNERSYFANLKIVGSDVRGAPEAITRLMENSTHNFQRPDAKHLEVDPGAKRLQGWGGELETGRNANGRWRYRTGVNWSSPGLELNDLGFLSVVDELGQWSSLAYVVDEPGPRLRRYNLSLFQNSDFDFSGRHLQDRLRLNGRLTFNNNWSASFNTRIETEETDTRALRGGPALLRPGSWSGGLFLRSDNTRNVVYNFNYNHAQALEGGSIFEAFAPGISFRLSDAVKLAADLEFADRREDLQYVGRPESGPLTRYVMAQMRRRTMEATARCDVNFTPQLSLSYYGNVYASAGRYTDFKQIISPLADRYEDRFALLDSSLQYDSDADRYSFDDAGVTFDFDNPDFNGRAFQSNLVLRWEYSPGSTLYAVWSQNRDNNERADFSPASEFERVFRTHPDNTFLIKLSYWLSI